MSRRNPKSLIEQTALNLLECAICLDVMETPKTLDCQHSFCIKCLASMVQSAWFMEGVLSPPRRLEISITCPTCKKVSGPFESLSKIGTVFIIERLSDAHDKDRSVSQGNEECSICNEVARFKCCR